jgi:excisionase family DNA binding protein
MIEASVSKALLTPQQVAEQLQVSLTSVYALLWKGAIPSAKIGRLRRVSADALQRYVDDCTMACNQDPLDDER